MTTISPWLPTAPCTTSRCLPPDVPMVGPGRRLIRAVAVVSVLLAGIVLSPLARRCTAQRRDRLVRLWTRTVVTAFGIRIRAVGSLAQGPVLVVANHISWLDVPLLAAVKPGRMLAKSEVGEYPLLGALARRGGTLFIDRERLRALPATVNAIAAALRGGSTVVAFPEGSTWCGRRQGRFRPAVFQAALDAGTAVQPVVIRYRLPGQDPTAVAAFVGEDTLLASLRRVTAARGLVAEVVALPPVACGAHVDRKLLARAVQDLVMPEARGKDYAPGHDGTP
ncbi:lysophospholipid acyltransferase family protein [Streptomyces gobiensis]|uniref:lysophospholipid acyltransferase family protein n=1 Tax=Streptomyces gobiensis TaxID=2875706 RepID=UPI001E64B119|nr:lysophospholipid acyltransferase family protein [Streptomyces gobiensis]UGY94459.1 1-acyl-sn-glycerol-3-phosphate acyltransferase [Streptomyces gobiensis]